MDTKEKLAIDGGQPVRSKPYSTSRGLGAFGPEEIAAANEVLESRSLFRYYGPNLLEKSALLERRLRLLTGAEHALAVTSGTAALICGLVGLGVEEGDEVIIPAVTFIATVAAVVQVRAVPVFAEVDASLTMDPASVEANITAKTKAVVPVHLANVVADMDAIHAVTQPRSITTLEDAAQAVGTQYKGRAAGSIGDAGAFSFQLEKNMTSGEGGALLTSTWEVFDRAARYQDQGGQFTTSKGEVREHTSGPPFLGTNFRITELQSAIAEVQLAKLPAQIARAREHAHTIRDGLSDLGLSWRTIPDPDGEGGSVMFFCDTAEQAGAVIRALRAEGIPAGQMYAGRPVYMNPSVLARATPWEHGCPWNCELHPTDRTYYEGLCPATEDLMRRHVLIGVGPRMSRQDAQDAVAAVRKVAAALLS